MPLRWTSSIVQRGDGQTLPNFASICSVSIELPSGSQGDASNSNVDLEPYSCDGRPTTVKLGFGESEAAAAIEACVSRMKSREVVELTLRYHHDGADDEARTERKSSGRTSEGCRVDDIEHCDKSAGGDVTVFSSQPDQGIDGVRLQITLHSFSPALDIYALSYASKMSLARELKDIGVRLYSAGTFSSAFRFFSKASKILICADRRSAELDEQLRMLTCKCYLNMAACQLRWGQFTFVADNCKKALSLADDCRAHYRLGTAYYGLRNLEDAKACFERALALQPTNKEVLADLNRVTGELKQMDNSLARNLRKMF